MSKIILLNGCGSSGKTTISKAIQHLSDEPWLHIGVDNLIDLMPSRFVMFGDKSEVGYFKYTSDKNERGNAIKIQCSEKGNKMFNMLPKFAKQIADLGENIIIDEVLIGKSQKDIYFETLQPHKIYFVGVYCDLDVMQSREILRGNRCVGLSNAQFDVVHKDYERIYDLKVDTTNTPTDKLAKKILDFVTNNQEELKCGPNLK